MPLMPAMPMQEPPTGLSWVQVLFAIATCGLIIGGLAGMILYKRKRRAELGERPPQREKVLRPPGYAASLRLDEATESALFAMLQAAAAGGLLSLILSLLFPVFELFIHGRVGFKGISAPKVGPALVSAGLMCLGLALWLVWSVLRFWRVENDVRNWRFGLRGEQAVAEKLGSPELARAGYHAFHDVPGDGKWNIDHVVVGPGGVFVLETKARARKKATHQQPDHVVNFDGEVLQFPWCYDKTAVAQAKRNAEWVSKRLADYGPPGLHVEPIIVVPGWFVQCQTNPKDHRVKAMNSVALVDYLKTAKPRYAEEQLRGLKKRLDEDCRTLEF
jgi:hypothetical protein